MGTELGAYRLGKKIASSAISETFLATSASDTDSERQVLIERLLANADAKSISQFVEDAQVSMELVHPNIVRTLELGTAGPRWVARELVAGINLLGFLREQARAKRIPDPCVAVWIACELLVALDQTARVHGRISTSNVQLGLAGEVKLGGFGALRPFELGGPLIELGYVSPEYLNGHALDARSDVFVIGILLAELLMGRRLFLAGHELDVLVMVRDVQLGRFETSARDLDGTLVDIVRSSLRRAQAERPTVVELLDVLAAWLKIQGRASLRADLASAVALACASRDQHADSARVPEIDVLFGRAQSVPPIPTKTTKPMPTPALKTPPKGVPTVVRIPAVPPVPSVRRTSIGAAVAPPVPAPPVPPEAEVAAPRDPAKRPTTPRARVDSDLDWSGVTGDDVRPLDDSAVPDAIGQVGSRPSGTSLGMPPIREPGLQLELEESPVHGIAALPLTFTPESVQVREVANGFAEKEDTFVGMPPPREPAIQAKPLDTLALSAADIASALALHESLIVELERAPDQAGTLSETSPLRVLFDLIGSRATGLFAVCRGPAKITLHLRDGQPQSMWSNESPNLLGDYLVARNVLTEEQLAAVLARARQPGKLAEMLSELRLINPIVMLRHLNRHIATRVVDLCTWRSGAYGWFAGKQDPRAAFPIEGDSIAILGEGALALDDETMGAWLTVHGRSKPRPARDPRVPVERFQVTGLANALDELDGIRSIDQLLTRESDRIERARVARMIHLLVMCGLAVV